MTRETVPGCWPGSDKCPLSEFRFCSLYHEVAKIRWPGSDVRIGTFTQFRHVVFYTTTANTILAAVCLGKAGFSGSPWVFPPLDPEDLISGTTFFMGQTTSFLLFNQQCQSMEELASEAIYMRGIVPPLYMMPSPVNLCRGHLWVFTLLHNIKVGILSGGGWSHMACEFPIAVKS